MSVAAAGATTLTVQGERREEHGHRSTRTAAPIRERLGRHRALWCLLVYAALSLLVYAPASPLSRTELPVAGLGNAAGSDPAQMTWFLSYLPWALTHGASLFHTDLINYPAGINVADNTQTPVLSLLGWPITAALGPIATFNLFIRSVFFLSAGSMFFVLGRFCSTWQARFVGGLFYGFSPYVTAHALHLDLALVPVPPLFVLLGYELLVGGRRSARMIGLTAGLLAAVEFLISPDIVSESAVIGAILLCGLALVYRARVRPLARRVLSAAAYGVVLFGAITGVQIFEMLTGPDHLSGPVLQVSNLQGDSADLFGSVVPTSGELLAPPFISHLGDDLVSSNLSENGSYLGLPLLLGLVMILRRLRRDPNVVFFALAAGAAFIMSLGGHLTIAAWRSPIPLPGDLFVHLPLLEDTIPARYSLFVVLFLTIPLSIGFEYVVHSWGAMRQEHAAPVRGGRSARLLGSPRRRVALLGALVALCLLPDAPFVSASVPWAPALPGVLQRLLPPGAVVATDPWTGLNHADAMDWQAIDHMDFRLVGGYANIEVPGADFGGKGVRYSPFPTTWPDYPARNVSPSAQLEYHRLVAQAESALRAYLADDNISAFVYIGAQTPNDGWATVGFDAARTLPPASYAFYTAVLGAPRAVGKGYVIWLRGSGWDRAGT